MALTPKQSRFIDEYMIDLNATQAAIRAGYSKHTAKQIGQQNLTKLDVACEINKRIAVEQDQAIVTRDMVLTGLLEEARRTGEGSTHGARVAAWSWLGKYHRMWADADDGSSGTGAPVTVNINILNYAES